MALLTQETPLNKQQPVEQKTNIVSSRDQEYNTSVNTNSFESVNNLITFVAGSSWKVDYYQQVLGVNDELSSQDLSKTAPYQQYTKITALEFKVDQGIDESQDEQTKNFTVTGSSTLYPPVIPNVGDMFVAIIGDGRKAVFSITNTQRLTILKDTCYSVEYVLVDFATDERVKDLESKVVKDTYFVKRLLEHGENPLITNEDYNFYLYLIDVEAELKFNYFNQYFDKTISSLKVPGQVMTTYDPFLVKFIKSFMDTDEHPKLKSIKSYTVDMPNKTLPTTLWDCLLNLSDALLNFTNEKLALIPSASFATIPQFEGVYFSNVARVVYPVDKDYSDLDHADFKTTKYGVVDIEHHFKTKSLGDLSSLNRTTSDTGPVKFKPIDVDGYYVLSNNFYHGITNGMSQIELLVYSALTNKPIDQKVLSELCKSQYKWPELERFYYVPILMVLIKMVKRGQ